MDTSIWSCNLELAKFIGFPSRVTERKTAFQAEVGKVLDSLIPLLEIEVRALHFAHEKRRLFSINVTIYLFYQCLLGCIHLVHTE